jgi:hypothetical protein
METIKYVQGIFRLRNLFVKTIFVSLVTKLKFRFYYFI